MSRSLSRATASAARSTIAISTLTLLLPLLLLTLSLAPSFSNSFELETDHSREDDELLKRWREFSEFEEFRSWRRAFHRRNRDERELEFHLLGGRSSSGSIQERKVGILNPPPIDQAALMARYIVNQADWASVATISSRKDTLNYPFVNVIALSDGRRGDGTGDLYLFLTPLDFTGQDVFRDNRATLAVSLAQRRYCEAKNYDPMDPRCARVVFSGKIKAVTKENPEYAKARSSIFGRHPWLSHMPKDHHFFFAKLKIATIALLDTFGGPKIISVEDYMNPPKNNSSID
ncbi:hypothetical protein QAD02_011562 [Eretmocerus hayati]|uniref:Uncharacterized protein n=1 Tax=Eretmocerus hayati TaxID=131215 RepID=A0ACC2NYV2_9HYME|nr:hypothetical protein QAD02_011562 [Eretmocerus hayati]